jgi:hypothetical protein
MPNNAKLENTPVPIFSLPNHNQDLVHLSDQGVDLVFTVSEVTPQDVVSEFTWAETTSWVAKLEWPEEVGGLLEVRADGVDLVDQIFNTDDAVFSEAGLNDGVVGKSNALLVDLSVSALVDELTDGLEVRVTVGDPWLDNLKHLKGGLGQTNEDTIVDLKETEKLEDLAGLWCDLVDTANRYLAYANTEISGMRSLPLDTDDEDQLRLSWDIEGSLLLGHTVETDLLTLFVAVLLDVLLSTLEDNFTLCLVGLFTNSR